jgi:hypothetical protein
MAEIFSDRSSEPRAERLVAVDFIPVYIAPAEVVVS